MIMFFAIKQFSDALEYTKTAMVLGLISMPINAFFNWIFIYGHWGAPRLELYGTGLSTFITRVIMMIVMMVVVFKHRIFVDYIKARKEAWKVDLKTWKDLLHIGVPSSLQYSMEAGAFAISGIMIGWLGATTQAAHQIALEIASMTFMASLGLSAAGSIRVANANGRNDKPLIRQIGISTMYTSLLYGLVCAVLFVAFKDSLPRIFNDNLMVVSMASTLLLWGALFQISDATQAVGVGLLRGIRDVKLPTAFVAIAYWVIGIPAGYYLAFPAKMGASGIWLGFVCGLTVSSVLLNFRFLKRTKPALQIFQS
jgi:MATE family multidrug resistance protein